MSVDKSDLAQMDYKIIPTENRGIYTRDKNDQFPLAWNIKFDYLSKMIDWINFPTDSLFTETRQYLS